MKAKDLRLGNIILDDDNLLIRVEQIAFESETELTEVINGFNENMLRDCKGVPLTNNILIKLGFENWGDVTVNEYEKFERWVLHNVIDGTSNFEVHIIYSNYGKTNHKEICFSIDDDERLYVYQTDFLHNLQNTYFMVTGNEIEYKL